MASNTLDDLDSERITGSPSSDPRIGQHAEDSSLAQRMDALPGETPEPIHLTGTWNDGIDEHLFQAFKDGRIQHRHEELLSGQVQAQSSSIVATCNKWIIPMKELTLTCQSVTTLRYDRPMMRVICDRGVLAERGRMADNPLARLVGLQFARRFDRGEALLLRPCNAVHTCFVRFPIDVLFLSSDGRIVRLIPEMKPWRLSPVIRGASQTLELPAGTAREWNLEEGDRLTFERIT